MDQYLEVINDACLPVDSLVIFQHPERRRFLSKDYKGLNSFLVESLIHSDQNHGYFVDWTKTLYHSLIFDIDVKNGHGDTTDLLMRFFDSLFVDLLGKILRLHTVTVIIAMRKDRWGGMHLHIPGFAISQDDYFHLCSSMKNHCNYKEQDSHLELDILSGLSLVGCSKPPCTFNLVYEPVRTVRIQYRRKCECRTLKMDKMESYKLTFHRDTSCAFDQVTNAMYRETAFLMSPIPEKEWPVLYFSTKILINPHFTHFTSYLGKTPYSIHKSKYLQEKPHQSDGSYLYQFMKRNANSIKGDNLPFRATKTWYKRFVSNDVDEGIFKNINAQLRTHCVHLRNETNPLQCILRNGEFVLPVFYALCSTLKTKTEYSITEALIELHEPVKEILKDPETLQTYHNLYPPLTFKTILYCAFRTYPSTASEGIFWSNIRMGWDWILESTKTIPEMQSHILFIQENHYPMVNGEKHAYLWNPRTDSWNICKNLEAVVLDIYFQIMYSKIPGKLRIELDANPEWIQETVVRIQLAILDSDKIPVKKIPKSYDYYGRNVPEYLFVDE